jgi:hypothetical protein
MAETADAEKDAGEARERGEGAVEQAKERELEDVARTQSWRTWSTDRRS